MKETSAELLALIFVRGFFGALIGMVLAVGAYLWWRTAWILLVGPVAMLCAIIFGDKFYRWL